MKVAAVSSTNVVPKTRNSKKQPKKLSAMYCKRPDEADTFGWQFRFF
jgi:hypothetical protein